MFTYSKTADDPLFYIGDQGVYTQFKKEESKRIPPFRDSKKYLDSDDFRERYNLSRQEGKLLKKAVHSNIVPEGRLKKKFYEIRKDLNQRLYNELDLRETDKTIHWEYPHKITKWGTTSLVIGSSGVGKTHLVKEWILRALKQKKKRVFIYVSPEVMQDDTLKELRNNTRLANYFKPLDVSDDALKESGLGNAGQFWDERVFPTLSGAEPGTVIVLDDSPDAVVHRQLQKFMIKYLRTGRHRRVAVVSLQHNIRGSRWTSQAFSSVKNIILFPRGGGKGKIVDYLNETVGLTRKRAALMCEIFAESGRWMAIHSWSPVVLYGPKYAIWT